MVQVSNIRRRQSATAVLTTEIQHSPFTPLTSFDFEPHSSAPSLPHFYIRAAGLRCCNPNWWEGLKSGLWHKMCANYNLTTPKGSAPIYYRTNLIPVYLLLCLFTHRIKATLITHASKWPSFRSVAGCFRSLRASSQWRRPNLVAKRTGNVCIT